MAYTPNKTTLGQKNAMIMQEAKKRASLNLALTGEKVRKSLSRQGTFGMVATGRSALSSSMRKSQPGIRTSAGPNLRTASRSSRKTMGSVNSGLLSDVNSNGMISAKTEALFKKPIDYAAMKGNACDERLAELIKQYNIRMPIKMIEDGKYMFGTRIVKANLEMNCVMVRVGGGYREFFEYIKCEEIELRRM